MARTFPPPVTVTSIWQREVFQIVIDVGGTQAAPVYVLKGICNYVQRDTTTDAELQRKPFTASIVISDGQIPGALKTVIGNITARMDSLSLPEDTGL